MSACPVCIQAVDHILPLFATDAEIPLLRAQLVQESGLNPLAQSPTGPIGVSQFTRRTWAEMLPDSPPEHRVDIYHAIMAQVLYMKPLLKWAAGFATGDDVARFALAAYNAGRGAIEHTRTKAHTEGRHPELWAEVSHFLPFILGPDKASETSNYVTRIMGSIKP